MRKNAIARLEKQKAKDSIVVKDPFFVQEAYTFIYDSLGRPVAMGKHRLNTQAADDGDDDYEIEIFLYKDTKGAWVDGLGFHGIPKQYDTFDNAVTAGYVYYKYGKVREKGEL